MKVVYTDAGEARYCTSINKQPPVSRAEKTWKYGKNASRTNLKIYRNPQMNLRTFGHLSRKLSKFHLIPPNLLLFHPYSEITIQNTIFVKQYSRYWLSKCKNSKEPSRMVEFASKTHLKFSQLVKEAEIVFDVARTEENSFQSYKNNVMSYISFFASNIIITGEQHTALLADNP